MLTPTLSQTSTDTYVDGDLHMADFNSEVKSIEANAKSIQDKIARLTDPGKDSPPRSTHGSPANTVTTSSSFSPGSNHVSTSAQLLQLQVDRLKGQLEALEKENALLQAAAAHQPPSPDGDVTVLQAELADAKSQLQSVKDERNSLLSQLSSSKGEVTSLTRVSEDRQTKLETLTKSNTELTAQFASLQDAQRETEAKVKDLTSTVSEKDDLIQTLKSTLDAKTSKEGEASAAAKAKDAEIEHLQSRIKRAAADFDVERKELQYQVEELRNAGQVCALARVCLSCSDLDPS